MTEDIIQNTEEELTEDENGQLYEHLRIVVDKGQVPLRTQAETVYRELPIRALYM